MSVKKIQPENIRKGDALVVKTVFGMADAPYGKVFFADSDGQSVFNGRRKIEFIYRLSDLEDPLPCTAKKPEDVSELPRWTARMDSMKFNIQLVKENIQFFEEDEDGHPLAQKFYAVFASEDDEDAPVLNTNWLVPLEAPRFKEKHNEYLFHDVEIPLPKKSVASSDKETGLMALIESMDIPAKLSDNEEGNATCFVLRDNGKGSLHSDKPCHGFTTSLKGANINCIVTYIKSNPYHSEDSTLDLTAPSVMYYYDWLFNRSPLSSAFAVKDTHWCLENRVYVTDASAVSNQFAMANIAGRLPWESLTKVKVMYALVSKGVPENLAFVVGNLATGDSNIMFDQQDSWHYPLDPSTMSNKSIINFMNGEMVNMNKPYREAVEFTHPNRVFDLYGKCDGAKADLYKSLKEIKNSSGGWGGGAYPFEKAIEYALIAIKEWCEYEL